MVHEAIRKGTLALELTPVLMGSASQNKGVQPLLNTIVKYLPSPLDIENDALDLDGRGGKAGPYSKAHPIRPW